jgi:hypothetical protein
MFIKCCHVYLHVEPLACSRGAGLQQNALGRAGAAAAEPLAGPVDHGGGRAGPVRTGKLVEPDPVSRRGQVVDRAPARPRIERVASERGCKSTKVHHGVRSSGGASAGVASLMREDQHLIEARPVEATAHIRCPVQSPGRWCTVGGVGDGRQHAVERQPWLTRPVAAVCALHRQDPQRWPASTAAHQKEQRRWWMRQPAKSYAGAEPSRQGALVSSAVPPSHTHRGAACGKSADIPESRAPFPPLPPSILPFFMCMYRDDRAPPQNPVCPRVPTMSCARRKPAPSAGPFPGRLARILVVPVQLA